MRLEKILLSLSSALSGYSMLALHMLCETADLLNSHSILSKENRTGINGFVTRIMNKTGNSKSSHLALLHLD